jgi:PPOX class probable F420-dependent enzyme
VTNPSPPVRLSRANEQFLAESHLATLITLRSDGSPHAAPVRFTWDAVAGLVRIMTGSSHRKAMNLAAQTGARAVVCQVDGFRWLTLEGCGEVSADPKRIAEGARRYERRYQTPPPAPPDLVVIEIAIDRVLPTIS